jgi:hypothetical protein
MFGFKRDEVTGGGGMSYNELHSLYSSQNITTIIQSRRMRLKGPVARMERREAHTKFW